jgi:hypothetical protein
MFRYFLKHLLLHKLNSNDAVLAKMIALIDHTIVSLTERLTSIDVEVIIHLFHSLHFRKTFKSYIRTSLYLSTSGSWGERGLDG